MTRLGPWIQPPDVAYTIHPSTVSVLSFGCGLGVGTFQPFPYTVVSTTSQSAVGGFTVDSWDAVWDSGVEQSTAGYGVVRNNSVTFSATEPSGAWPAGAIGLEYETDMGFGPGVIIPQEQHMVVTARAVAGATDRIGGGVAYSRWHGGTVYHLLADDYPGFGVAFQPADLALLPVLVDLAGIPDVNDPLDPQGEALYVLDIVGAAGDGFVFIDAYQSAESLEEPVGLDRAGGGLFLSGISFYGTFTPSRYRFIYAARTPVRGRQRASGVIGSTPLRGRQGDKWGLRGRQNSNL